MALSGDVLRYAQLSFATESDGRVLSLRIRSQSETFSDSPGGMGVATGESQPVSKKQQTKIQNVHNILQHAGKVIADDFIIQFRAVQMPASVCNISVPLVKTRYKSYKAHARYSIYHRVLNLNNPYHISNTKILNTKRDAKQKRMK